MEVVVGGDYLKVPPPACGPGQVVHNMPLGSGAAGRRRRRSEGVKLDLSSVSHILILL